MPNLRSRQIPSPSETLIKRTGFTSPVIEPPTPAKLTEPIAATEPVRRRSLRLSSSDYATPQKRSRFEDVLAEKTVLPLGKTTDFTASENDDNSVSIGVSSDVELGLGQTDGIIENKFGGSDFLSYSEGTVLPPSKTTDFTAVGNDDDSTSVSARVSSETKELDDKVKDFGVNVSLSLWSGTGVCKRLSGDDGAKVSNDVKEEVGDKGGGSECSGREPHVKSGRRYSREEKGKGKLIVGDQGGVIEDNDGGSVLDEVGLRSLERFSWEEPWSSKWNVDTQGIAYVMENDYSSLFLGSENNLTTPRSYTKQEKGKDVPSSDDPVIGGGDDGGFRTMNLDVSGIGMNPCEKVDEAVDLGGELNGGVHQNRHTRMKEQHKIIARQNALKYAHFSADDDEGQGEEQEDGEDSECDEMSPEIIGQNVEDWPGPFSTAMKIIRDREKFLGGELKNSCSLSSGMPLISWTPKNEMGRGGRKGAVPSLHILCLKILSENVDAIGSLTFVPDVLRHKLCQMLCDSRRMNAHFFSRLLEGSPTEIRVADCSWLEEEEFESSIKECKTSKLTVLQLDLCGHCISDSSLLKAVAQKGLPVLTTISLKGACRISDAGLSALMSAAPVLRSMNLSQCSLLTDVGIKTIADSLGSIVHELYLDDCDTLDAMRILPSLQRLVKLEVLSLRGIGGVSDRFIRKLIMSNGQNMKELILANCVNVTDSSLKIIAETCSQLVVLDLSYLRKLTDVGMAYIANGCRGIQDLRLCRNEFSDDAIAAFLEASGGTLRELSLNNITKVGQNTILSLARRCKNLESLDLSWCRSLTDEALGLIADSCMSLRLLKIFGCTQITRTFIDGHSNRDLHVTGMKLTPILGHIKRPDFQHGPLYYSAAPSF